MSNVYKRNRKPTAYELYMLPLNIKTILIEMDKGKKNKCFPGIHRNTYVSLIHRIDDIIESTTTIYNLKVNLNDNYNNLLNEIIKAINLTESCIQLLQGHYKNLGLYKSKEKSAIKVCKRIVNLSKLYIELSEKLKKYKTILNEKPIVLNMMI